MNHSINQVMELIRSSASTYVTLALIYLVFVVICIIHLLKQKNIEPSKKVIWILVILFIQVLGPIAYLFKGHKNE